MNQPDDIDSPRSGEAAQPTRGTLKLFLGAAPGVGKTYEMLREATARRAAGTDVVVAVVETHGQAETEALLDGLETIPRREITFEGRALREMDLDAVLARRPALAIVDDLAHANPPECRHPMRWQDVEELLDAGIDVFSTLNVENIESLSDVIAGFTRVPVERTVPDTVLDRAEIEVVDIPPDELIERLKDGKVHVPHEATRALAHYFSKSTLSALRETALRRAAQAADEEMLEQVRANALGGTWAASERVLVAVSELPGADALVRAAKRIADAQHAPWTAVHIETPRARNFTDEQRQRVAAVLQLARQLGGRVASLSAPSVIEGIKRAAKDLHATQIVVGKSARSRWFELRHGSVVDRLVRETPGVAIHVLPHGQGTTREEAAAPARTKRQGGWGRPSGYVAAALAVAIITLLGTTIYTLGHITNIGLLYLIPVMFAATRYGVRTGIATGIVSSLCYNFFFIPPVHAFTIQDPANLITVLVLIGVAIVASQFAERVRAQADLARQSARQNSALAGFARTLTAISSSSELGQTLCAEVARLLDVDTVLLLPTDGELRRVAAVPGEERLGTIEQAAAQWAFEHGQPTGLGSNTLTASDWLFHPLRAGERTLGVFGLARVEGGVPVRSDQLPLLLSLLDQAALALERIALEGEMASVERIRERDRLRAALLASVGHDLKAPLKAIASATAALKREGADPALVATLHGGSARLERFVTNLLDMARMESGALTLEREPVDLADAVADAAHALRKVLGDHKITLDVSPELPLVAVDPQLFRRCLINLLENAGKYAAPGAPIAVVATRRSDGLDLSVIDEGLGLPPGGEAAIFDALARPDRALRKGGAGLGLAMVKAFAGEMGLSVSAANRDEPRGAAFTIHFPESALVRRTAAPGAAPDEAP